MSFTEVSAIQEESVALDALVADLGDATLQSATQFKEWRVADILRHLAVWNDAAALTLTDPPAFGRFFAELMQAMQSGGSLVDFEQSLVPSASPRQHRENWQQSYLALNDLYRDADPKTRVQWGGPDMSLRSCISARLMETWANGQAIFDLCGIERIEHERIRNIVVLGITTFAFYFRINGLPVPEQAPKVPLTSPGGETWQFNTDSTSGEVVGYAHEFCQVVTQVRNVADTALTVKGETALTWMRIAQCFAGPPTQPPAAGTRFIQRPEHHE